MGKKLLTGNKDALWTLDCFHNDNDFKMEMHRKDMEEICTNNKVYEGILEPLIEALEATKSDNVKIHSCEIIGGQSRIPSVQTKVLEVIQKYEGDEIVKSLSTTLNGDESVARGCALMCAMLSPNYRVKEFQVQDILTWPITISYPSEKEENQKNIEQLIMQRGNPQPCTAKVMFNKTKNFVFKLQHPQEYKVKDTVVNIEYPFSTNLGIGEFNVQLLPLSEKAVQAPKIKLLLDINKQGLLDWPKASLIEYVKKEKKIEPKKENKSDKKKDNKQKKEDDKEDKDKKDDDNDTQMKNERPKEEEPKKETETETNDEDENKEKTDDKASENKMDVDDEDEDDAKDKKKEKKKDKKKITRNLMITGNFFNELKASEYNKMFELEANFINVDRIVHETDEAKNDLETWVYDLRDKLDSTHSDFIEQKDKESTTEILTKMEDWIYDHGDDANKTQFLERLKQLKDIGDPMEYKKWESEHRQQRVENFKKLVFKYQQWVTTEDEQYAHIAEDQRKIVKKYADDADAWSTQQLIKQDRLKKHENPVLKCKDVDNKYREVYDQCNKIVMTPKPKPPKKEEKKEDEKDKKESKDAETNGNDAAATTETNKSTDDDKEKDVDAEMKDKSGNEETA